MPKAQSGRGLADFAARAAAVIALLVLCMPAAAVAPPRLKPPAPGPLYLNRADIALLNETREAIERRNWSAAKATAQRVADPIAKSLAEWFYFYAEDPKVDLGEVDAFLDMHPDWPALSKIQMHAEKRMPNDAPARAVLDFFDARDPLTGEGELKLARALFSTGDSAAALIHVRDAWVNHDFTLADEQKLLANYGRRLAPEDHAARVDRLLWERQVTAARRVFSRLEARDRRMAEARAALLLGASSGPDLFYALGDEERLDPGVLLAAVRYYRRREEEPRAAALAFNAPAEPASLRNPARWWDERQLLMRWALTERRYADAYALAAGHGLEPALDFAEAEFDAGWIALRFLNAPERAETHFKALVGAVGAPISLARAYYWLARAAEARGDMPLAEARYAVAAGYVYTYYGQIAAERLGGASLAATFAPPVQPTPADKARFSSRPAVAALRILSELDDDQAFLIFAYNVDDQLETPGEYVELARLAERKGATHIAVRAGKVGAGRHAFAAEVVYPVIFVPDEAARFAPPEIILGLSRQESEFNPRAYSHAGARGLMQILPSTAQITARKEGLRYSRSALLDDPDYNLIVGAAHLAHLFERYGGSRVMTFAAYNAGVSRVEEWVERYGDPRSPDVDPIDWVEQIPFAETRNYVQRVLENTQVYRSRLTDGPIAGRLSADLDLGGPSRRAGQLPNLSYANALPPLPQRTALFAGAVQLAQPGKTLLDDPASAADGERIAAESAPETTIEGMNAADTRIDTDLSGELSDADKADFSGDRPSPAEADHDRRRKGPAMAGEGRTPPAAPPQTSAAPQPALSKFIGSKRARKEEAPAAAADDIAAATPGETPETEAPTEPPESDSQLALAAASPEMAPGGVTPECQTYTAYIASTDQQEASAADLNAGMLAELQSGAPGCARPAEPPEITED